MTPSNVAPTSACPFHIDLRDPHARATIYATYARMREQGDVIPAVLTMSDQDDRDFSGALGREVSLALGYETASDTLVDSHYSVDGRSLMSADELAAMPPVPVEFKPLLRNLLSLDPPDHTRLRRLVQPSWTPRVLETLRPRIQVLADELLDAAEAQATAREEREPDRTMELIDAYAYPLPMTVISELLGVPAEDRPRVRAWSEALIEQQAFTEHLLETVSEFSAYLRQLFEEKRERPTEDMTSWLVHADIDGERLDEDDLLSMVFILIVAGHVTTVNLIANGVLALLNHPDQRELLRARPELMPNAVEEVLRYWGPVEMASPRFTREPGRLGERDMARGDVVFPVLAAANRDPERFADPDRFDIERPDAHRHIAFGKGAHLCLGAPLARIEAQVALETISRRMPYLRLREPLAQPPLQQGLFRGPGSLSLLF